MSKLFKAENSDSDDELNINTDYANNYDNWRQKEELHKLKGKYGESVSLSVNSGNESSESSEDDEGEEIPEEFEKDFYKTLSCLKKKDPSIYNKDVRFFQEFEHNNLVNGTQPKEKTEKSLFLRDYERKIIVEKGGKFSDSEDEIEEKRNHQPRGPTYVQEQQELKQSFKKILENGDDNEDEDLFLKPKIKSNEETQKEEKDYKNWLKGQGKNIDEEEKKVLKPLRDFWTNPNLDKNEKFLRDYILNKKFLDKESADFQNYDHKIHDSDENLSEDENNLNKQEEFEHKYNFRFEEPDQEFIKRYPRTLDHSLRKKDNRRSQKRLEIKTRKEQEKLKKREDLKQLKALKRKEIEEKLEKLKEVTGNDDLNINIIDLDENFDPEEHDKKMREIFNDEYYAEQEEDVKPEFPEIDDELNIESTWDNYDPNTEEIVEGEVPYHEPIHCEDPDFNMDADFNGQTSFEAELLQSSKKNKKRRRSKFSEMIAKDKPKFDPTQYSSYKEYYDQYYALDYEDMIDDLPCRFKYRNVVPNDYGLSIEEILTADDRELNKWCPLRKALQHKSEHQEKNDVKMFKQKASNEGLKKKILKSLFKTPEEENENAVLDQNLKQLDNKNKKNRKNKIKHGEKIVKDPAKEIEKNKEENENAIVGQGLEQQESKSKKNRKNKVKHGEKIDAKETEKNEEENENATDGQALEQQHNKSKKNRKNKVKHDEKVGENEIEINEDSKKVNKSSKSSETIENDIISEKSMKKNSKGKRKYEESLSESVESISVSKSKKMKKTTQNNSIEKNYPEKTLNVANKIQLHENERNDSSKKVLKTQQSGNWKKNKSNNQNKKKDGLNGKNNRKQFKKNTKNGKADVDDVIASLSEERLRAYGFNPKKFKNKLKYKKNK